MKVALLLLPKYSSLCKASYSIAKLCGCVVKEHACSICGDDCVINSPLASSSWALGSSNKALSQLVSAIQLDETFSCEFYNSTLQVIGNLRMMRVVKLFTFYKGAGCRCIGRIKSKKSHSLDLDATLLWIVTLCYHISMEVDMHILYHSFQ